MTDEIRVRDVADADFEDWRALWAGYNAFYGRSGATALSERVVLSSWRRILDPAEPVHGIVAEREGRLVGLAHFIFHRNMITIENTCYLQDLFSDPRMRGKGVGRRLVGEVFERAGRARSIGVYWHTHASNETAMRLYDAMATNTGFVVYRKSLRSEET